MNLLTISIALVAAVLTLTTHLSANSNTLDDILLLARNAQKLPNHQLKGEFQRGNTQIPFLLHLKGGDIQYQFQYPHETLNIRLGNDSQSLGHTINGRVQSTAPSALARYFRSTDITLEDLTMPFLYWPKAELLGTSLIKMQLSHKVKLTAPNDQFLYGEVLVWVNKRLGCLMKVEGFDHSGKLIKRIEIQGSHKIDGILTIAKVTATSYDPGTGKVHGTTTMTTRKP